MEVLKLDIVGSYSYKPDVESVSYDGNNSQYTKECVICGTEEKLVVDHDHATGKVRGMLCNHCNRGLGHFKDSPMLLEFAAQYLYASSDAPQWEQYLKEYGNC